MARIPSAATTTVTPTKSTNDITAFDTNDFLKLMITELQNQDPLNPVDNSQLLDQISQIRDIGATEQLTNTLGSVLIGQNLATASGLIGKDVAALSDSLEEVRGTVDRVTVEVNGSDETKRTLRVHIGDQKVDLNNIREVFGADGTSVELTTDVGG
jgi:flagellar basal-body rod modification protein FlgD